MNHPGDQEVPLPGCAHLNIVHELGVCDGQNIRGEVVKDGANYDIWRCRDCRTEFIPSISRDASQKSLVAELVKFVELVCSPESAILTNADAELAQGKALLARAREGAKP